MRCWKRGPRTVYFNVRWGMPNRNVPTSKLRKAGSRLSERNPCEWLKTCHSLPSITAQKTYHMKVESHYDYYLECGMWPLDSWPLKYGSKSLKWPSSCSASSWSHDCIRNVNKTWKWCDGKILKPANRNGRWIHASSLKFQIGKRETQTRPWKVKCLSAKAQKARFSNCQDLFFSSLEQYLSHILWPMHNQISLLRGVLHQWKRNLSFTWKRIKIFIVIFVTKSVDMARTFSRNHGHKRFDTGCNISTLCLNCSGIIAPQEHSQQNPA